MSWSDRRTILAMLALAGCGFTPVYGPGGGARGLTGQVAVDPPEDGDGFVLVQALQDRLGRPRSPRYRLAATIRMEEQQLGVTPGQVITRYQVVGRVNYRLIDIDSGSDLRRSRVESFTSYSATGTVVATRSARRDARERLMRILADRVVAELLATAEAWR